MTAQMILRESIWLALITWGGGDRTRANNSSAPSLFTKLYSRWIMMLYQQGTLTSQPTACLRDRIPVGPTWCRLMGSAWKIGDFSRLFGGSGPRYEQTARFFLATCFYLILEQNHKYGCGWRLPKAEYASRGNGEVGRQVAEATGFPAFISYM
ncbi:hypothetical protein V8C35DRAFT_194002 [Trichoderma chlorosporum]